MHVLTSAHQVHFLFGLYEYDIDALYKVRRKNCLRKTSVLAHNVWLSLTVHFSGRIAAIAVIGAPWSVSPAKTAEPIEMPLGRLSRLCPRNHVSAAGVD